MIAMVRIRHLTKFIHTIQIFKYFNFKKMSGPKEFGMDWSERNFEEKRDREQKTNRGEKKLQMTTIRTEDEEIAT